MHMITLKLCKNKLEECHLAKYTTVLLDLNHGKLLNLNDISIDIKNALNDTYCIYVYYSEVTSKIYVGQTKNFINRNSEHYTNNEQNKNDYNKFNKSKFNKVMILFSKYIEGGAPSDDLEAQLITLLKADRSLTKKTNNISYDEDIINKTNGNKINNYDKKDEILSEVLIPFWDNELKKYLNCQTNLNELRENLLYSYSPLKRLSRDQEEIIKEIINSNENYVIQGDAGTGKTVMLTNLVASLCQDKNLKVGVVTQPNWIKTADYIFKAYGVSSKQLNILTSTQLINKYLKDKQPFDVIIIDESHKLSKKYGKQHPSFNAVYRDEFASKNSHLEIIKDISHQLILMYDPLQSIRPSNLSREDFAILTRNFTRKNLKTQFRIKIHGDEDYTSEDYINGIKYLLFKDTGILKYTTFDSNFNNKVFKDKRTDSYFGYFTNKPLHKLNKWIDDDKNFNHHHINRILAGLCEPWKQTDGNDPNKFHWIEGNMKRRWNSTQENWLSSDDADAEEQIGSVFAVQGLDLDKVGVLIGNDLDVNKNNQLFANPDNFYNVNGIFTNEEMENPIIRKEFTILILNIYYVLLTRGISGIRLGFWKNDKFLNYMKKTLNI